jgi:hypothetical protein
MDLPSSVERSQAFDCRDAPPRFIRGRRSRGLAPGWQTKGADIHSGLGDCLRVFCLSVLGGRHRRGKPRGSDRSLLLKKLIPLSGISDRPEVGRYLKKQRSRCFTL